MWYKNAIEGYKEVSNIQYWGSSGTKPDELNLYVNSENNPGFHPGESITYVNGEARFSGEVVGVYNVKTYINGTLTPIIRVAVKVDLPNIADYKEMKGGRIYSVYNPETTVQSQGVAEAEVIGVSQPETVIDKASEGAKKVIEDIKVNQASIFSGKNILIVLGASMVLAYFRK